MGRHPAGLLFFAPAVLPGGPRRPGSLRRGGPSSCSSSLMSVCLWRSAPPYRRSGWRPRRLRSALRACGPDLRAIHGARAGRRGFLAPVGRALAAVSAGLLFASILPFPFPRLFAAILARFFPLGHSRASLRAAFSATRPFSLSLVSVGQPFRISRRSPGSSLVCGGVQVSPFTPRPPPPFLGFRHSPMLVVCPYRCMTCLNCRV